MSTWPPLPLVAWQHTYATLHRYAQIVGKIQLALTPPVNHYWNVAFHLTPRGLTTRPMPYQDRTFAIDLDFIASDLVVRTSGGAVCRLALAPRPVEEFYRELTSLLGTLGIDVQIDDHPVEIPEERVPFHRDRLHSSYEPADVMRWFDVLRRVAVVLEEFRARFTGKASPVHFFWGSFDLAASRFSGRSASLAAGADPITRESYSHEVSSVGFWPGDVRFPEAAFYAYQVPAPEGFEHARIRPPGAFWHRKLSEFILPYEAVRQARDPRAVLLDFCQSTYEAGADLAGWPRADLERAPEPREAERPSMETPPPVPGT